MSKLETKLKSFLENYLTKITDNSVVPFYEDDFFSPYIWTQYYDLANAILTDIKIHFYPILGVFTISAEQDGKEFFSADVDQYDEDLLLDIYRQLYIPKEKTKSENVYDDKIALWFDGLTNEQRYDLRIDSSLAGPYADLDDAQKAEAEKLYADAHSINEEEIEAVEAAIENTFDDSKSFIENYSDYLIGKTIRLKDSPDDSHIISGINADTDDMINIKLDSNTKTLSITKDYFQNLIDGDIIPDELSGDEFALEIQDKAAKGKKVKNIEQRYWVDYYTKVGGHGELSGYSSTIEPEFTKAKRLLTESKLDGSLPELGYIGVNGWGNEFAIVYIDQNYFTNMSENDFKDKVSYDSWMSVAREVLANGKPQIGKYKTAANGTKIEYPTNRLPINEQSIEERELQLFIENDGDLYRQRIVPIHTNLVTKIARGTFDINLAPKIYAYLIADGIKKYTKDYGGITLTKADKENLAKIFVNEFLDEARYGNYENYLPKKYTVTKLSKGGYLVGKSHAEGGIEVLAPNGLIEVEGGEVVINKAAVAENCELLSKINQSAGDGVAFDCECETAAKGKKIETDGELFSIGEKKSKNSYGTPILTYVVDFGKIDVGNNHTLGHVVDALSQRKDAYEIYSAIGDMESDAELDILYKDNYGNKYKDSFVVMEFPRKKIIEAAKGKKVGSRPQINLVWRPKLKRFGTERIEDHNYIGQYNNHKGNYVSEEDIDSVVEKMINDGIDVEVIRTIESPYFVYDLKNQNVVQYFENEIEAEQFVSDITSDDYEARYEVRINEDYKAAKGKKIPFDKSVIDFIEVEQKRSTPFKYRFKILQGAPIVLREELSGSPVEKTEFYDSDTAIDVAKILNEFYAKKFKLTGDYHNLKLDPNPVRWTAADNKASIKEGWIISNDEEGDDVIQKDDDSDKFKNDEEASLWVFKKAKLTNSPLHQKATFLVTGRMLAKGNKIDSNEIRYKGKTITKLFPSGMYEVYSDKKERFLKFDTLADAKELVEDELEELSDAARGKKIKRDFVEFRIPEWALGALINGDYSGLNDEEEIKVNNFVKQVADDYGNAMFILPDENERNEGFSYSNDIDNMGSNTETLFLLPSKGSKAAKGTKISRSQKQYNKEVDTYNWYVINPTTKKVESGFESKNDAEDLRKEMNEPKDWKVVAKSSLKQFGIEIPNEKWKQSDKDFLPTISVYSKYLQIASHRFRITMDEARNKYGLYTVGQWEKLFNDSAAKGKKVKSKQYPYTTGIYLSSYKTDYPDGTPYGFDADFGEMVAYKGKVISIHDLPKDIKIKKIRK